MKSKESSEILSLDQDEDAKDRIALRRSRSRIISTDFSLLFPRCFMDQQQAYIRPGFECGFCDFRESCLAAVAA
ncbi:MAG: hypothetical protein R3C28_11195 [Pirellulaceae bacterium]